MNLNDLLPKITIDRIDLENDVDHIVVTVNIVLTNFNDDVVDWNDHNLNNALSVILEASEKLRFKKDMSEWVKIPEGYQTNFKYKINDAKFPDISFKYGIHVDEEIVRVALDIPSDIKFDAVPLETLVVMQNGSTELDNVNDFRFEFVPDSLLVDQELTFKMNLESFGNRVESSFNSNVFSGLTKTYQGEDGIHLMFHVDMKELAKQKSLFSHVASMNNFETDIMPHYLIKDITVTRTRVGYGKYDGKNIEPTKLNDNDIPEVVGSGLTSFGEAVYSGGIISEIKVKQSASNIRTFVIHDVDFKYVTDGNWAYSLSICVEDGSRVYLREINEELNKWSHYLDGVINEASNGLIYDHMLNRFDPMFVNRNNPKLDELMESATNAASLFGRNRIPRLSFGSMNVWQVEKLQNMLLELSALIGYTMNQSGFKNDQSNASRGDVQWDINESYSFFQTFDAYVPKKYGATLFGKQTGVLDVSVETFKSRLKIESDKFYKTERFTNTLTPMTYIVGENEVNNIEPKGAFDFSIYSKLMASVAEVNLDIEFNNETLLESFSRILETENVTISESKSVSDMIAAGRLSTSMDSNLVQTGNRREAEKGIDNELIRRLQSFLFYKYIIKNDKLTSIYDPEVPGHVDIKKLPLQLKAISDAYTNNPEAAFKFDHGDPAFESHDRFAALWYYFKNIYVIQYLFGFESAKRPVWKNIQKEHDFDLMDDEVVVFRAVPLVQHDIKLVRNDVMEIPLVSNVFYVSKNGKFDLQRLKVNIAEQFTTEQPLPFTNPVTVSPTSTKPQLGFQGFTGGLK